MLVRMYETIFITRLETEAEAVEKLHGRLTKALETLGGAELKLADWGKRKLAYEINRQKKGNYWYFGYVSTPEFVAECERQLRLSTEVLRYQTVRLSELDQFEAFDIEAERKRVEGLTPEREEDEEEQYLRRQSEDGYRGGRDRGGRHDDDDDNEEEAV
ncbi:MAG: 30S ribosomal protein S6 [Myxococcota bacterium]